MGLGVSALFVIVFASYLLKAKNLISLYSLYMVSISAFLGGRFLASLFLEKNVFVTTYMVFTKASYEEVITLYNYLFLFISSTHLAWLACYSKVQQSVLKEKKLTFEYHKCAQILFILAVLILGFYFFSNRAVFLSGNYLSLYKDQNSASYSANYVVYGQMMLALAFGLLATHKSNLKTAVMLFMFVFSFGFLFLGARSYIVTTLLMVLLGTNYSREKFSGVNLRKLLFYSLLFIGIIYLAQFILVSRAGESIAGMELSIGFILAQFFYMQGVSLMIFHLAIEVHDYPVLPIFASFIPSFGHFISIFDPKMIYELSYSHFISHHYEKNLYAQGMGLGWTIMADLYYMSRGNPLVFFTLNFLLTSVIVIFENKSYKNAFFRAMLVAISFKIMMLPRNTLSSVIPTLYYQLIILGGLLLIFISIKKACKVGAQK